MEIGGLRVSDMHSAGVGNQVVRPRHSVLDLAPLELECMSALWPMGEGTVRDIHGVLAKERARAYTTVLTIMDRLTHKGIVARRKVGRAYLYHANLSADEARLKAVEKIVAGFFDGSTDALAAHLAAQYGRGRSVPSSASVVVDTRGAMDQILEPQGLDEALL